jgi:hypothetical protein
VLLVKRRPADVSCVEVTLRTTRCRRRERRLASMPRSRPASDLERWTQPLRGRFKR